MDKYGAQKAPEAPLTPASLAEVRYGDIQNMEGVAYEDNNDSLENGENNMLDNTPKYGRMAKNFKEQTL